MNKKIKWLVQDVGMNFSKLDSISQALERLEFNKNSFGVIPFTQEITGLESLLEDDCIYVLLSGTKVLTILDNVQSISEVNSHLSIEQINNSKQHLKSLKNGIFYDVQRFDQAFYGKLNLPLLNSDAEYFSVIDNAHLSFNELKFIKPSRDLKAFNGGILEIGQTIENFITTQQHQIFWKEEQIVVAPCKKIFAEYRFFIVNEEVITASQYKLGDKVVSNPYVPDFVMDAARDYCKLYQPHDIFTMDIADTPDGCFIVEYNCWNASGHYDCDILKMYHNVQEYMINKY